MTEEQPRPFRPERQRIVVYLDHEEAQALWEAAKADRVCLEDVAKQAILRDLRQRGRLGRRAG